MRIVQLIAMILATAPLPALAQEGGDAPRVKRILIYGNDRCPTGSAGEVIVCARRPEEERYRVPRRFREAPPNAASRSWAERAEALDQASPDGLNSCSTVGPAGFTGCWAEQMRAARQAREQEQGAAPQ